MSVSNRARDPLGELTLLQREVGLLFERLMELQGGDQPPGGDWVPPVDVYESEGCVVVVVEVPGLPAESLRVVFHEGQVAISGKREERRRAGTVAGFLCMERPHGSFRRRIPVEGALDFDSARARLARGILTVTLPRLEERRKKEIVISIQSEPDE